MWIFVTMLIYKLIMEGNEYDADLDTDRDADTDIHLVNVNHSTHI